MIINDLKRRKLYTYDAEGRSKLFFMVINYRIIEGFGLIFFFFLIFSIEYGKVIHCSNFVYTHSL